MEVVLPPKHTGILYRYLRPLVPDGALHTEEPDGTDYDPDQLLILLLDAGQTGPQAHTYWNCLTTVEVRHPDRGVALQVARWVETQLRGVQLPSVYFISNLGNPTYTPDEERRIPIYAWTVEHRVRGELSSTDNPISL